jgi:hypothetical protein
MDLLLGSQFHNEKMKFHFLYFNVFMTMKIMITRSISKFWMPLLINMIVFNFSFIAEAQSLKPKSGKELFLPDSIWLVPPGNDFNDSTSEYCYLRMAESENIVAFWAKEYGTDPMSNPDSTKRFDVKDALLECERFYDFYVNKLKFVEKGHSLTDKYKVLIFIFGGEDGTAYGGGEASKVGILWTAPKRMLYQPYGALAHELGHSFQYLVNADSEKKDGSLGHSIYEMTSQYMLWQVYPEWMTFENYHLIDFLKQTHFAFLHEMNMYHSPYVLEYWSEKHGIEFMGKLWREAQQNEDPVMAYKRLTSISQKEFNDEIFDAARKFVTWDMKRIEQVAKPYANKHFTKLDTLADGWYQISPEKCPQNYGYNAIKMEVPNSNKKIKVKFNGIAGNDGFRNIQVEKAGWRYGFLAVKKNGERVYGEMYTEANGEFSYKAPADTEHLWLVVSGAPTEHWQHIVDGEDKNDEQWPYQIKFTGTKPTFEMIK